MKFFASNIIAILILAVEITAEYVVMVVYNHSLQVFLGFLTAHIALGFLALVGLGNFVLRFTSPIRKFTTEEEQELIYPVVSAVYKAVVADNENARDNIQFYLEDSMNINAYAMGTKTIVFTRGILEAMGEDELKGVTAHEMGHILNGDTMVALVVITSNAVFGVFIGIFLKLFGFLFSGVANKLIRETPFMNKIVPLMHKAVGTIITGLRTLVGALLAFKSRGDEYRADDYARRIGFGEGLKSALTILSAINFSALSLTERMLSSHPHLADRIDRLEREEPIVEEKAEPRKIFINRPERTPKRKKIIHEKATPAPVTPLVPEPRDHKGHSNWYGKQYRDHEKKENKGTEKKVEPATEKPIYKPVPREQASMPMFDRTNRIIRLKTGERLYIIEHKVYRDENYYFVAPIEGEWLGVSRKVIHEIRDGAKRYFATETDPAIIEILGME